MTTPRQKFTDDVEPIDPKLHRAAVTAQMALDAAEELRRKATRDLDAAVYAWHNAGASYTQIARALDRDRSTIIARYKNEVARCDPTA